jgi:predicted DNA-binding transcriptional regulator AlpA
MNLLTKKEAARLVGLHPESVMRLARNGHFPKPLKYGPNARHSIRFVESEIQEWIEARIAERKPTSAAGGGS